MADRETIEKVIRNAYAARIGKDLDNVMKFFAPDATFQLAGSAAASPVAVRARGSTDLRATFGALIVAFDILELTLLTSVVEGDKAAMHWRAKVRYNPTGEVHDTELFDLWTIEQGRVTCVVQFADTALIAKLMAQNQ